MSTFFTADQHFGHTNIISYTNRPHTDVDQMNEDIVYKWNSIVSNQDKVYVLGDICMGRISDSLQLVDLLNGTKYLVPGNHDRMFNVNSSKKHFQWIEQYEKVGLEIFPFTQVMGKIKRKKVLLSHFPYSGDSHEKDRFVEMRPIDKGLHLLHGHTHGAWRKKGRMIDVGVDAWGGVPVSEDEVHDLQKSTITDVPPLIWI